MDAAKMYDSSNSLHLNIYDEEITDSAACDYSSQGIEIVPHFENKMLCVLYLQNNKIKFLPDDFFPSLPGLVYLDLRDNLLTEIPKAISKHASLTHLLLQNNKITALPSELGSVVALKVLQLNGNPLTFPPKDVLNAGISKIMTFLHEKYVQDVLLERSQSEYSEDNSNIVHFKDISNPEIRSYNSVLDGDKIKKNNLRIKFNEKDSEYSEEEYYPKVKGKCPKLAKSRHKILTPFSQSSRYLKTPSVGTNTKAELEKIKRNYMKELAIKKHKELLAKREKIIQHRKTLESLKDWRQNYRSRQMFSDGSYRLDPNQFPYDTSPEYMTLLTREDIEKDLPDKFRKKLYRRSKPTVPRKTNNDVHLALKIKQLFENLEAIDLNKQGLTPRTEQKVLLSEIQKITEIKQKLTELSLTNTRSIAAD